VDELLGHGTSADKPVCETDQSIVVCPKDGLEGRPVAPLDAGDEVGIRPRR